MTLGSITATGTTTTRLIEDHLGDIINVKSFGATGNGSTDDSGAIQAAFDAAFGTTASPHGGAGRFSNKPVFFPVGNYRVVTPLTLRSIYGGYIFGAGSDCTKLFYDGVVSGSPFTCLIKTNGFVFSRFEGLHLSIGGNFTIAFYLYWDNTGDAGLHANTFMDIRFTGEGGPSDGFQTQGMLIGYLGISEGSENVFINCVWDGFSHAGLKTAQDNSLNQTVIGGKAINCQYGMWASTGSIEAIIGATFSGNTIYDISNDNGNSMVVSGCYSTSPNFCKNENTFMKISGVTHAGTASGKFLQMNAGATVIDSCVVGNGSTGVGIISGASKVYLRGNNFQASDYLTAAFTGTVSQNI
jgi:hypothetical protein